METLIVFIMASLYMGDTSPGSNGKKGWLLSVIIGAALFILLVSGLKLLAMIGK